MDLTTELPCLPVEPKTVMVSFATGVSGLRALVEEADELENRARKLWRVDGSLGIERGILENGRSRMTARTVGQKK